MSVSRLVFRCAGQCRLIPALPGFTPPPGHRVAAWRVREALSLLWVGANTTLIDFQRRLFAQDRLILESQRPRRLPPAVGELFCTADRLSTAYRRWLCGMNFNHGCC